VRGPESTGSHFKNFSKYEQEKILFNLLQIDDRFTYENILANSKIRKMINVYNVSTFYDNFATPENMVQGSLF